MSVVPSFDSEPQPELDHQLCDFDETKLRFRAPVPDFDSSFIAVLGGGETYGRYVAEPYPSLLSEWADIPVMNFGVLQAGLSLFSQERWLIDMASKADLTVLQVLGAQNMSNRLYSVHSRRNDRFIGVSPALREIYPQVDFAEINFTGHLLATLKATSQSSFDVLVDELKWAWVQRMRRLVSSIQSDVLLLWISDHAPDETQNNLDESEPHFVDQTMLDSLADEVVGVVKVVSEPEQWLDSDAFSEHDINAVRRMPGPKQHAAIAEAILDVAQEKGISLGRSFERPNVMDQSFSMRDGTASKRSATKP